MTDLKTRYTDGARRRFLKVGVVLAGLGVTADMLTITGLLLHAVAVPFIVTGHFVTAAVSRSSPASATHSTALWLGPGWGQQGRGFPRFDHRSHVRDADLGALVIYMARHERWYECVAVLVAMGAAQLVSYTRARAEALGVECKVGLMSRRADRGAQRGVPVLRMVHRRRKHPHHRHLRARRAHIGDRRSADEMSWARCVPEDDALRLTRRPAGYATRPVIYSRALARARPGPSEIP